MTDSPLSQDVARFLRYLGVERQLSPITLLNYQRQLDAIIALGAIIRGSTPHFDFVASESAKGLSSVAIDYNIPVANGVLTTDSIEQAIERSGTKAGNRGSEAAMVVLEMLAVLSQLDIADDYDNNEDGQ